MDRFLQHKCLIYECEGLVLSAFFWGYALGQLPASFVADRIGSKATFGFAILAPSLLTLLVPIASKASFSAALCIRALIGLAAAGTFPSCYHFYPRWVPIMERTKLIAYVCSGMYTVGYLLLSAFITDVFIFREKFWDSRCRGFSLEQI